MEKKTSEILFRLIKIPMSIYTPEVQFVWMKKMTLSYLVSSELIRKNNLKLVTWTESETVSDANAYCIKGKKKRTRPPFILVFYSISVPLSFWCRQSIPSIMWVVAGANGPSDQVLNHPYVTIITNAGSSIILVYSVIGKQLFFTHTVSVLFYQIEENGASLILPSSIAKNS